MGRAALCCPHTSVLPEPASRGTPHILARQRPRAAPDRERPHLPPVDMGDTGLAAAWRGLACWMKTVPVGSAEPRHAHWPEHLPVGAFRVVRWSAHYDQMVIFYRDTIGLPVLETFHNSYGLDGTILGLPDGSVHLEIVRLRGAPQPAPGRDQLVFYLP